MNVSERRLFRLLQELGVQVLPQVRVGPWTVDFLFPDLRIVVEADSRQYHAAREDARRDRYRDEDLQARGYGVVHVWSDDLYARGGAAKVRDHVRLRVRRLRGVWLGGRGSERQIERLAVRVELRDRAAVPEGLAGLTGRA